MKIDVGIAENDGGPQPRPRLGKLLADPQWNPRAGSRKPQGRWLPRLAASALTEPRGPSNRHRHPSADATCPSLWAIETICGPCDVGRADEPAPGDGRRADTRAPEYQTRSGQSKDGLTIVPGATLHTAGFDATATARSVPVLRDADACAAGFPGLKPRSVGFRRADTSLKRAATDSGSQRMTLPTFTSGSMAKSRIHLFMVLRDTSNEVHRVSSLTRGLGGGGTDMTATRLAGPRAGWSARAREFSAYRCQQTRGLGTNARRESPAREGEDFCPARTHLDASTGARGHLPRT